MIVKIDDEIKTALAILARVIEILAVPNVSLIHNLTKKSGSFPFVPEKIRESQYTKLKN